MNMRSVGNRNFRLPIPRGFLPGLALLSAAFLVLGSDEGIQLPSSPLKPLARTDSGTLPAGGSAAGLAKASVSSNPVSITEVTSAQAAGKITVRASTSGLVSHQESLIPNPPRLVVDLINAEMASPFFDLRVNTGGIKKVRVRQFQSTDPKIARMVFDLEENHGKYEIATDPQSVQVVFDLSTVATGRAESPSEKPAPRTQPAPKDAIERSAAPHPAPASAVRTASPTVTEPARSAAPASASVRPAPRRKDIERPSTTAVRELAAVEIPQSVPVPAESPKQSLTAAVEPPGQGATPAPVLARAAAPPPRPPVAPPSTNYAGQPLTLDLVDISLVDFFRLMAEEGGINIVMDPEIKGTISIKVVKVPWDQIFDAALVNNGLDKQVEGNLVRIAKKTTLQEEAKQREALKKANTLAADVETRIKRLNYAKAAELVETLTDQKTVRGTIVVDERTNSLVVSDLPSSIERMMGLIEKLDVPQPQVEIEARIVSATRDFARDIGVQFGFVAGNLERVSVGGPNTFGTIGGTRPAATPKNTYAAGNPITGRGASQSQSTESAGVSTGLSNDGNFNVNIPSQRPLGGLGISVGNIFDTFLLDAAITAGESRGLAKLISQPKVTAQNNSAATITQGLRFPVQIIANNTITVQFQNAALTLTVTPQITYEGNVVLDLKVENNTPDFGRTVNGIPSIRTSESATRVLVSDGGTTVIGGILLENESTQEDRVPGLASLPLVGHLFKRTAVSHSTQEVLFFVTPRIVK
ncbi:MAG: type IV pilus secretin PilQ [Acidobacteria bacterium]|nr:type IV pilus secretin PilQ [Acidobacteriota bacterium]